MRLVRGLALALILIAIAFAVTLAMPVTQWRTGEMPVPPLTLTSPSPAAAHRRIWIDTDAACGESARTDPDDCLAILMLARQPGLSIIGLSTVFGNASIDVTDRIAREIRNELVRDGIDLPAVQRGSAQALSRTVSAPADRAIETALSQGPMTIVALGPLTNVALALRRRPDLRPNVERLVAVMGSQMGHLFHPTEGARGANLFGHGPVFRDFNFEMDREAAADVLAMGLPQTFVPYEVARTAEIGSRDIDRLEAAGGASARVAALSRSWLEHWQQEIGRAGFYPFDLFAAAYVADPELFRCAGVHAWTGKDPLMFVPFLRPTALMITQNPTSIADPDVLGSGLYCPEAAPALASRLRSRLGVIDESEE